MLDFKLSGREVKDHVRLPSPTVERLLLQHDKVASRASQPMTTAVKYRQQCW
jgi:hypothetical protein